MQAGYFYVHPDKAKMALINVVEKEVNAVVYRVKEAVAGILSEEFEIVGKPNCWYCNYGSICNFYKS